MHYHYFTIEQRATLARQIIGAIGAQGESGRLDSALSFLRSPEYGICEACGTDIPYARLYDNPFLTRCRSCSTDR